jgi:MoaA/NifB/PqqE/SkfB family radical SAM enzyme
VSYLKQFDDVTIYETSLLHKKYECEIRQTIIEEHCKDRWCLNVDIDEFFDHPFSNILSMKELLTYLKKKNYTSVVANMLDMFAKETEFSESKINTDLLNKYCYYDISHLQNNKYFSKFKVYCLYNSLADKRMKYYYGGIRDTLFKTPSSRYLLVKHPLIYVNGKLEPVTNPHFCNKANIADITCLLRHYKLTASFKSKVQNLRDDLVYFAQKEYDAYNNVIKDTNSLNLNSKTMVKFKHVNELIENNFLKVSDQYLEFFNLKTKSIDMFTALKQLFAGKKTTSYLDTFPPDKDLPYKVMLYWYISNTCNFSCPQCAGHAVILKKKYAPERIKIRELKKFLKGFDYKIRISFTGGEPFIVKNINKIFSEITKEHYISLVTNLVSPAVKKFARTIDPGRVQFVVASAHMIELEKRGLLNTFLNNCTLLLNKGFNLEVTEVAYPFIVDKVAGYKKVFEDIGIKLRFFAFRGTWKNKQYPNSYTDEEIKLFNLDNSLETSPDIFNRKGNLCNAGHNIAVMMNNLEIQPCFSIEKNIGSMSKGVVFNKNLIRCPVENCGCPFFAFEPILYNMAVEETCPKQEVLVDSVI